MFKANFEMHKTVPELNYLLKEVEKRFGRRLSTSADYEVLSIVIEHESGELVSASTLKRLWGYVALKPSPRLSTLDVLARYIGKRDFLSFRQSLQESKADVSCFFSTKAAYSSELEKGAELLIGWNPNRLVRLRHNGNGTFTVIQSENSKLIVGDQFQAESFMVGYPLYIARILRNGEYTLPYIAGTKDGLNRVDVIQKDESQ